MHNCMRSHALIYAQMHTHTHTHTHTRAHSEISIFTDHRQIAELKWEIVFGGAYV